MWATLGGASSLWEERFKIGVKARWWRCMPWEAEAILFTEWISGQPELPKLLHREALSQKHKRRRIGMKIVSDSPLQKPEGGSHFSPRFPDGDHPPERWQAGCARCWGAAECCPPFQAQTLVSLGAVQSSHGSAGDSPATLTCFPWL